MNVTVDMDVLIPMQDGVGLATHLWRPEAPGPVPVLLVRLPYGKDALPLLGGGAMPRILAVTEHGYAVAFQDCRGTGRSHGDFVPMVDDAGDGEDTIRWLADQPWCDGNVGMYGGSYLGMVQFRAAGTGVEALKAIAPGVAPAHISRPGDALTLSLLLTWTTTQSLQAAFMGSVDHPPAVTDDPASGQSSFGLVQLMGDMRARLEHTPVADHPTLLEHAPWLRDLLAPLSGGAAKFATNLEGLGVPGLHIGGWYDIAIKDTVGAYTAMRDSSATPEAREGQRLIVGPWTHLNMTGLFPERVFGPGANIETLNLTAVHLAFFDRWLKGDRTGLDAMAAVKIFVMGANEWRDEQQWPPAGVAYVDLYLDGGPANSVGGTGRLTEKPASPFTQTYLYDPRRPVPTRGGDTMSLEEFGGPTDQRPVEARDDVLCFSTDPLERPLEVIGPVNLTLFVSSSAVDTDFTAKLVDVEVDGRAILVCDGVRRMRHRSSRTADERMVPGDIYQITVDLGPTAIVFQPGHRIRLEVSSSNFPKHDRNSNSGGGIVNERLEDMVIAINHVHHGPDHPSRLTLPVMEP